MPHASRTVNTEFGSPVPVRVGVVSERRALFIGAVIPGADGTVESRVKVEATGEDVFPAPSVTVTLYVFNHSGNPDEGVNE